MNERILVAAAMQLHLFMCKIQCRMATVQCASIGSGAWKMDSILCYKGEKGHFILLILFIVCMCVLCTLKSTRRPLNMTKYMQACIAPMHLTLFYLTLYALLNWWKIRLKNTFSWIWKHQNLWISAQRSPLMHDIPLWWCTISGKINEHHRKFNFKWFR